MIHDVVIVGAGIFGLAVARALVARGVTSVVVLEQSQSASGATAASGGMIRAFHADEALCELGARSMTHWAALAARHPALHVRTGAVQVFPATAAVRLASLVAKLGELGIDAQLVDRDLTTVLPGLRRGAGYVAVYEPAGGYVDPRLVCGVWERELRVAGVLIADGTQVTSIEPDATVQLSTSRGPVIARAVVVATGAWAREFAPEEAGPHFARPIQFAWLEPRETLTLPTLIDHESDFYFRSDGHAVLAGLPMRHRADLERPEAGTPESAHAARIAAFAATLIAGLEGAKIVGGRRSFDGYRPEGRATCGRCVNGLYYLLGGSGGGLKLAPALAEDLAARIAGSF